MEAAVPIRKHLIEYLPMQCMPSQCPRRDRPAVCRRMVFQSRDGSGGHSPLDRLPVNSLPAWSESVGLANGRQGKCSRRGGTIGTVVIRLGLGPWLYSLREENAVPLLTHLGKEVQRC